MNQQAGFNLFKNVLNLGILDELQAGSCQEDDVSAAIHAAIANVAGLGSISGCGGLIQTTSG
jgi:hypothetical protein